MYVGSTVQPSSFISKVATVFKSAVTSLMNITGNDSHVKGFTSISHSKSQSLNNENSVDLRNAGLKKENSPCASFILIVVV